MSSERRVDPFGVAALAAAGTLAGHGLRLGSLTEGGDDGVSHAYLGALGPIVVLALQPLVAWTALRLLDTGRRIIEGLFVCERRSPTTADLPLPQWTVDVPITALVGDRLRVRGPPMA